MNVRENIELLKKICNDSTRFSKEERSAVLQAIGAAEKQIPKKPIKQIWIDDEKQKGDVRLATKDDVLTKDNHGSINLCPNCKEWVMRYKYLSPPNDRDYYCKHCGQALDWSDTE